jgi:hypothetical protein
VINFKCTRLIESDQRKKRNNKEAECGGHAELVTVVTVVPESDLQPQEEPQEVKRYFLCCANNPEHRTLIPRDVNIDLLLDLLNNDLQLPEWYCQQVRALGIVDENGNFGIPCSFVLRTCELTQKCRKSLPLLCMK